MQVRKSFGHFSANSPDSLMMNMEKALFTNISMQRSSAKASNKATEKTFLALCPFGANPSDWLQPHRRAVNYLWYLLSRKSSNHAFQRTRSASAQDRGLCAAPPFQPRPLNASVRLDKTPLRPYTFCIYHGGINEY